MDLQQPLPAVKSKLWQLWVAAFATVFMAFFFAFDAGQFSIDRTQNIPMTICFGFVFAFGWLAKKYLKQKLSPAPRALAAGVGLVILAASSYAGFHVGQSAAYPSDAKRAMREIQLHLKSIKAVKAVITNQTRSMRDPAQILDLEPNVAAWSNQVANVEELLQKAYLQSNPAFISGMLDLIEKALSFDRSELENLQKQIGVVKSVQGTIATARAAAYRKQLTPLIEQQEKIEIERKSFDFPQQLKRVAMQSGFDESDGDKLAAIAVRANQ